MAGSGPDEEDRLSVMADRLNVCMVSMHTSPTDQPGSGDAGGMNVVLMGQAVALAARGHRVNIVTRRADSTSPDVEQLSPRVWLRRLEAGPPAKLPKSKVSDYLEPCEAALAKLEPFDIYHSHHWMSGVAALPIALSHHRPHFQSFHSLAAPVGSPLSDGEPAEVPERLAAESFLAHHSAVIAVSLAEAASVIQRFDADPRQVSVIRPGVDHQLFRPTLPGDVEWASTHGEHWPNGYLAFAGRLQPLKAPDLAIEALAAMPAERRPHLVLAGDGSPDFADYRAGLEQLAAERQVENQVSFVGSLSRPDFAAMLRGAQLVMVPSYSETFGLVALEAAASGTPVLAAASGGLVEAVVPGRTGWLMESRDPTSWADVLTQVLAVPEGLARLGHRAYRHSRRYDWQRTARELGKLYRHRMERGHL